MSNTNDDTNMTGNADNCDPLRTKSGQGERLKVAAHTEEQIRAFCRSHQIPRPNVVRIRRPEDLLGWRSTRLLLLPSWWLGTNSDTVPVARDRGWELADVTEDEVLNGPTPPAERPTTEEFPSGHAVLIDPVRLSDLERQLAEARERLSSAERREALNLRQVQDAIEGIYRHHSVVSMCEDTFERYRELLAVTTEQRDRLAEAAKEGLTSVDRAIADHSVDKGSRLDVAFQPLREALAAVKETKPNAQGDSQTPAKKL